MDFLEMFPIFRKNYPIKDVILRSGTSFSDLGSDNVREAILRENETCKIFERLHQREKFESIVQLGLDFKKNR